MLTITQTVTQVFILSCRRWVSWALIIIFFISQKPDLHKTPADPFSCAVKGCNSKKRKGTTLFNIPTTAKLNPRAYKKWVTALNFTHSEMTSSRKICSLHFDEGFIITSPRRGNRLNMFSVPTKNLPRKRKHIEYDVCEEVVYEQPCKKFKVEMETKTSYEFEVVYNPFINIVL